MSILFSWMQTLASPLQKAVETRSQSAGALVRGAAARAWPSPLPCGRRSERGGPSQDCTCPSMTDMGCSGEVSASSTRRVIAQRMMPVRPLRRRLAELRMRRFAPGLSIGDVEGDGLRGGSERLVDQLRWRFSHLAPYASRSGVQGAAQFQDPKADRGGKDSRQNRGHSTAMRDETIC